MQTPKRGRAASEAQKEEQKPREPVRARQSAPRRSGGLRSSNQKSTVSTTVPRRSSATDASRRTTVHQITSLDAADDALRVSKAKSDKEDEEEDSSSRFDTVRAQAGSPSSPSTVAAGRRVFKSTQAMQNGTYVAKKYEGKKYNTVDAKTPVAGFFRPTDTRPTAAIEPAAMNVQSRLDYLMTKMSDESANDDEEDDLSVLRSLRDRRSLQDRRTVGAQASVSATLSEQAEPEFLQPEETKPMKKPVVRKTKPMKKPVAKRGAK